MATCEGPSEETEERTKSCTGGLSEGAKQVSAHARNVSNIVTHIVCAQRLCQTSFRHEMCIEHAAVLERS